MGRLRGTVKIGGKPITLEAIRRKSHGISAPTTTTTAKPTTTTTTARPSTTTTTSMRPSTTTTSARPSTTTTAEPQKKKKSISQKYKNVFEQKRNQLEEAMKY